MEFSKEQKDFMRRFVGEDTKKHYSDAYSPFYLLNIIVEVAEIVKIHVKYDENSHTTTTGRVLKVTYLKDNPKFKGITSIFDWLHFFNYLRDNNYITVLTMGDKQKGSIYTYKWNDDALIALGRVSHGKYNDRSRDEQVSDDIHNEEIEDLKNWDRELIYPRPLLLELVARNFKTQEQVRFRKQMWVTIIALFASTTMGIVSAVIGICGLSKDSDEVDHQQHIESINVIKSTSVDTTQI